MDALPDRPTQLYQFTQGLHITAGIAIIPLLLAKLNVVMPALAQVPPVRGVLHLLERLSIAVLVSASIVQVGTGLLNTYQWYPWPFPFRQVHYACRTDHRFARRAHRVEAARDRALLAGAGRLRREGRFVADPTVGSELLPDGREARPPWVDAPRPSRRPARTPVA